MATIYGHIPTPVNVLLDIDDTLYHQPQYRSSGGRAEIVAIAHFLECDTKEAEAYIRNRRKHIRRMTGVDATLTQVVYALGMPADEWNRVRCSIWKPIHWLSRDTALCQAIQMFVSHPRVITQCPWKASVWASICYTELCSI